MQAVGEVELHPDVWMEDDLPNGTKWRWRAGGEISHAAAAWRCVRVLYRRRLSVHSTSCLKKGSLL
jgi:hypothetical protein